MSGIVTHGYADWNRAAISADSLIAQDVARATSTPVTYTIGYIGNYPGLYCWAKSVFNPLRVGLQFYSDAAMTNLIDEFDLDLQQGDVARQPIAVMAPYLKVVVTPGGVTPVTYTLTLTSAPPVGTYDTVAFRTLEIGSFNAAIGGAAALNLDSIYVLGGEIEWMVNMTGGNWSARLQAIDYLNGVHELDTCDNTTAASTPRRLWVPPAHIRIVLSNVNAAGQIYNAYVNRKRN